jgi:hypothetical protein
LKIKLYNISFLLTKDKTDVLSKMAGITFEDGVTSFRIMRNIQNISVELQTFESSRQKLVRQYGVENSETKIIEVLPNTPQMEEYLKQYNAMIQEEIEINILLLNPIHLKGFSPVELMQIDWMIEEPK